ncbi:aminotransferase class I/II-fold pyridoxal phosphate-dependent enzyme [Geodermatophilus sabuli]|uniref:aminotransferase class I/II-fold pyridoxal phosphate-dependent enzyme n=1 Tax=Geodermatophilus sabuli TaxID=1564158 RepID=UPI001952DA09
MSAAGAAPLYEQIADTLQAHIRSGVYRPGDRVPSVRKLREQHRVSVATALAALQVLENRGLVAARPQSGHYVRAPDRLHLREPEPSTPPGVACHVDASLAVTLNLGIGDPHEPTLGAAVQGIELVPVDALNRLLGQALRFQPSACHSYDAPPGTLALRQTVARRGLDAGYAVSPDDVVITSGAKEAVYLSIRAVTRPGDTVAIESPTYYALLEVLASLGLRAVEIASHPRHGIDLDQLADVLRTEPVAAVALVPTYANPTGSCMPDAAKARLVRLLETHDVPLVEDDVYGDLAFSGPRPRAVKAFDRRGLVLYCGSYSKTLSPGLRVGWAIPGRYRDQLQLLKLVVNQATAPAPQLAIAAFVDGGGFDRHLRRVRRMYRDQMDATLRAVSRHFPPQTCATRPDGGHVLWLQLPDGVDALELHGAAAAAGIRIAPGPMFSPSGGYRDFVRLNTGFPWRPSTERQIEHLGHLVTARRR